MVDPGVAGVLERRLAMLTLMGRQVPVERGAVNTMAGAMRMPYHRFAQLSAAAVIDRITQARTRRPPARLSVVPG